MAVREKIRGEMEQAAAAAVEERSEVCSCEFSSPYTSVLREMCSRAWTHGLGESAANTRSSACSILLDKPFDHTALGISSVMNRTPNRARVRGRTAEATDLLFSRYGVIS